MQILPITSADRSLIAQAKQIIATYYRRDRHRVGAALHTTSWLGDKQGRRMFHNG